VLNAFAEKQWAQVLFVVPGALCLGWASIGLSTTSAAAAIAIVVLGSLTLRRPGLTVGLLMLGLENGLPFLDTAQTIIGGAALADYLAVLMILILLLRWLTGSQRLPQPGFAFAGAVSFLLAAWWLFTIGHSDGEPLAAAIKFGRHYLIFAILVALFPLGLRSRRDWRDALTVLLIGTATYALGQIAITSGQALPWLVHPIAIRVSDVGLTRVYAFMGDAAVLAFSLSLGASLLAQTVKGKRLGTAGVLLFAIAIVLQQTRAVYVSLPLAIIALLALWVVRVPAAGTRLTGRVVRRVLVMAMLIGLLSVAAPHLITTYGAQPLSRLSGVISDVSTGTGNVSYRFHLAGQLTHLLQGEIGKYATGLGFLDPVYRHFPNLPMGSIQTSDLGLLDGIMLIGVVGVILIYALAALPLRMAYVTSRAEVHLTPHAWLLFGLSVWLAQVLIASYSLGTLFQAAGQALIAFVIGLSLHVCSQPGSATGLAPPTLRSMPAA